MKPSNASSNSRQKVVIQSSRKLPVGIGHTNRNVAGTGKSGKKTRGKFSSTNTDLLDEREFVWAGDQRIEVTPLPLVLTHEEAKEKRDAEPAARVSSNISDRKEPELSSISRSGQNSDVGVSLAHSTDQTEVLSEYSDEVPRAAEEQKEEYKAKEEDVDNLVEIELFETETKTIFHLPSIAVSLKAEDREHVDTLNDQYKQLLKEKASSDNYQSKPAQSINLMQKSKASITETVRTHDKEDIQVAEWMIHEAFKVSVKPPHEKMSSQYLTEISDTLNNQLKQKGILLDPERSLTDTYHSMNVSKQPSSYNATKEASSKPKQPDHSTSMLSSSSVNQSHSQENQQVVDTTPFKESTDVQLPESLLTKFNIVERILTQNRYLDQQILYRNYPKVEFSNALEEEKQEDTGIRGRFELMKQMQQKEEEEKEEEKKEDLTSPHLVDLFNYTCAEVENRNVTCADWNALNPDLLAVSYGEYDPFQKQKGLLLFWTLKSPKFPERIIETPSGIASCHFSRQNPNLIAIGSFDGVVAIYDMRKQDNTPIAESSQMSEKHIDTVWEVRWHNQGTEKGESLISISGDGRIAQWSIKKGLDCIDLLNLKKPTNPNQKDEKESAVFRNAVGFSLDFPKDQTLMYLASTEEGTIHKCSLSYNDELETYWGHSGPVYKIRCNHFWSNIMISCSDDWHVQVWDWRRDEEPLFSCHSLDLTDAVNDIEWSPSISSVFSSVCNDGRIEIWDLAESNINPIYTKKSDQREPPRTMVRFCEEYPVLVSGNTAGVVDVYRIMNLDSKVMTADEQKKRLEKAVYPAGRVGKEDFGEDDDEDEQQEV